MRLEPGLAEHEKQVDAIAKDVARLGKLVKAWKKATSNGSLGARSKSAAAAVELADRVKRGVEEASESWIFDTREYLVDAWMDELMETASAANLRAFRDGDELIVPPLVLSAKPGTESLVLEKQKLDMLRPVAVVREIQARLAKGRDSANQDFLDAVYKTWQRRPDQNTPLIRFKDVYETFALAPGWKKENSTASFAQMIYAVHTSGLTTTRAGVPFNLQEPSSQVKAKDLFEVRGRDGRTIRYYGISFIEVGK